MQPSGPRPEPRPEPKPGATVLPPEPRSLPLAGNLLAWAALVGVLTGLAVVGFHGLLGFINNFLFGPFVEGLLVIGRSSTAGSPDLLAIDLPPLNSSGATPLKALLDLGLGSIGFLPPPPLPPAPPPPSQSIPDWLALWPVVVVPTLGGLAVGLLRHWGGPLGPGLPSLMAMADGAMASAARLPLLRLVAASLSLGSGASLGPEGPSVESGGNLGLWLAQRAGLPPQSQKTLVAAGVAAGLAAGFKAPIAGVFFAFEGSLSTSPGRVSLRAVLVSAVASALVTQLCLGDTPILRLPSYEVRSPLELPLYLLLGLLASGMSLALIRLLALGRSEPTQRWISRLPPGLATALGGAVVGGMALAFPQVLGVGYDTIEALLGSDGGISLVTLVALIGVKLLAMAVSNATGFVGGGFAPALFLGAVLGSCYGQLLGDGGLHLPVAEAPAYAMVGMAAVLAGSARAPLTALLLLFELTRDIRIVLPLMAAAGLSAVLVERWQGVEDPGLLGPDLEEEQRRARLAELSVLKALDPESPLVLEGTIPASQALARLIGAHGHCLLVARENCIIGLVSLADLQRCLISATVTPSPSLESCRRSDLIWLPQSAHLDQLEDQLRPNDLRQLPVFAFPASKADYLPSGLPSGGLPVVSLRGLASRDGLARALAQRFMAPVDPGGAEGIRPPDRSGSAG